MFLTRMTRLMVRGCGLSLRPQGYFKLPGTSASSPILNGFRLVNQVREVNQTPPLYAERRFRDTHEWIEVDGNIGTVGISQFAANSLVNLVYIELPEVGKEVEKNDEVCCVESTKAVSGIYAPLTGKIVEVNNTLDLKPDLLTKLPSSTWIYKIEIKNKDDFQKLMSEEDYEKFLTYSKLNDPSRQVT